MSIADPSYQRVPCHTPSISRNTSRHTRKGQVQSNAMCTTERTDVCKFVHCEIFVRQDKVIEVDNTHNCSPHFDPMAITRFYHQQNIGLTEQTTSL